MNLLNILSHIENTNPEAAEKYVFSRRKLLKTTSVAAIATPAFFVATANKAFADEATVLDVLNFALTLEYLERDFYQQSQFVMGALIPPQDRPYIVQIAKHEAQHVDLLRSVLGPNAVPRPMFDFTARGAFPTVFSNYNVFLTVAQALEDTGVRAYKGQAPRLINDDAVLEVALRIHSVEARHAAFVRRKRGLRVWPSNGNNGGAPEAVYQGEDQLRQADVDLLGLSASKMYQKDPRLQERTVFEAFDEPLTKEQVLAIAGPFIRGM